MTSAAAGRAMIRLGWLWLAFAHGCGSGGVTIPDDSGSHDDAPGVANGADGPVTITVYESHACSINPGDDPRYVCGPGFDLVCISTYSATETGGGSRPVYICRRSCNPAQPSCPVPGDICCPGTGPSNLPGGCTPPSVCDARRDGSAG
jgi:hypothetical protein